LIHDVDGFAELLQGCTRALQGQDDAVLGFAPHSLRAVTGEELSALLPLNQGPVHIHIAEQTREVDACVAWSGMRPVQWLYEHAAVDPRWCLVHATHITEANLGDGLFPMQAFARAGGRFGVGSDSNVLIDAAEELRLLEYGQRLQLRGRNVLAPGDGQSTGRWLYEQSLSGAAQALGVSTGLQAGAPADLGELAPDHPALIARDGDALLDSWVFAARNGAVRSVWRQGRQLVRDGRHPQREAVAARFAAALRPLLGV
jgi:cytosine/adenosine deaminase-related metal-dependent hydrolase